MTLQSKYIALTRNKVVQARTLKQLNKKLNGNIQEDEMQRIGDTWVIRFDELDLDFIRDSRKLSSAFLDNMFKKDKTVMFLQIATLVLVFISIVRGG